MEHCGCSEFVSLTVSLQFVKAYCFVASLSFTTFLHWMAVRF